MSILIRLYEDLDWRELCQVHDKARPIELDGSVDASAFRPLSKSLAEEDDLFSGTVLVAIQKVSLVGFIAFTPNEVSWLYVDPMYFRKGIASQLLKAALISCEQCVQVVVLCKNHRALQFYEKHGFKIIKRTDGHLSGDETIFASGYTLER